MEWMTSREIAKLITDGSTIALTGFGGMGQCDAILKEIRNAYLQSGHPNGLTVFHAAGQSDQTNGIEYIAYEGLIKRVFGGHWGLAPNMRSLIEEERVEAFCLPQGQLTHLFRTMANGLPGHFSPIGLGTFVDPRVDGGKFNGKAKQSKIEPVDLITIQGKEYLFYKQIPIDFVFIRGTFIDESGNLSTDEEPLKLELLSAALAAKAHGGKVIVQAKYRVSNETIHPKKVTIPGYLVDYAVIAENPEEDHRQVPSATYDPKYSGDLRVPIDKISALPLSIRKVIGRRAIQEFKGGSVVNLGIGIPGDVIGPVSAEEEKLDQMTLTIESGVIGGVPIGKNEFGITINADAILDHESQFDYYHGSGVDIAYMGAAEIDQFGNVNVSKFGGRLVGCGGFMDVTQPAKKVVFCTTFTNGGLEIAIQNGELKILREGRNKKFVDQVEQITFSGKVASSNRKKVVFVTERAVFQLDEKGLTLIELAPGIDLEQDIIRQMAFQPNISPNMKRMDRQLFREDHQHA